MIPLVVALAGGLGAGSRFLLDSVIAGHNRLSFPLGTLVINVTASLALGLLVGWVMFGSGSSELKAVLGTGFLGGYSTFSTASVEGARLVRAGRPWAGVAHAGAMLVVSLGGSLAGLWVMGR